MTVKLTENIRKTWEVPTYRVPLWGGRTHSFCVVIPVINEGNRIKKLLERMMVYNIFDVADIIIIDGGSTDDSLDLDMLSGKGVSALLVKDDVGKLSAQLRCAYAFCLDQGYEGIITIDGNDKDDPIDIPKFIEKLQNGFDFVQGSRFIVGGRAENTPKIRHVAIRCLHAPALSLFANFHWTDTTQGYRAYSRKILLDNNVAPFRDVFKEYELLAYLSYIVPKLGHHCLEIPTTRRYPSTGDVPTKINGIKGNWSVLKVLFLACFGSYNVPQAKQHFK
jgi:glycosyltransferase involved in cell wall biosynthesis